VLCREGDRPEAFFGRREGSLFAVGGVVLQGPWSDQQLGNGRGVRDYAVFVTTLKVNLSLGRDFVLAGCAN